MFYRAAPGLGWKARTVAVLGALAFLYAFGLRPPECLDHGIGDGSMAHHAASGDHHAGAASGSHHSGGSHSSENCIHLKTGLCEFAWAAPEPLHFEGEFGTLAPQAARPHPESPALAASPFRLPPATGPPHAV